MIGGTVMEVRSGDRKTNRQTIPLGRVLGIPIGLHYSWFLIFVLLTWMLAASYYPTEFQGAGACGGGSILSDPGT